MQRKLSTIIAETEITERNYGRAWRTEEEADHVSKYVDAEVEHVSCWLHH